MLLQRLGLSTYSAYTTVVRLVQATVPGRPFCTPLPGSQTDEEQGGQQSTINNRDDQQVLGEQSVENVPILNSSVATASQSNPHQGFQQWSLGQSRDQQSTLKAQLNGATPTQHTDEEASPQDFRSTYESQQVQQQDIRSPRKDEQYRNAYRVGKEGQKKPEGLSSAYRSRGVIQQCTTWEGLRQYMEQCQAHGLREFEIEIIWRQLVALYVNKTNGLVAAQCPTEQDAGEDAKQFVNDLLIVTRQKAENVEDRLGSNYAAKIIYACGKLKYRNDDLLEVLEKAVLFDFNSDIFIPRYLSTALWGASLIGYYPKGLCDALCIVSRDFIQMFNIQNISNALFALSDFRHCPPHEKLDEFMERVRTLLQEEFDTIQPQNISDLTVALAQFQYKPQQDILSFIKDYAKKNAMEFSPRQAYHVLLGLTIFDVYDSDLMGVLEDEWEYDLGTSKLMDQESMIGFYLLFLSYFQHFGDEFPDTLFQHPFTAKSRDLWLQAGKMWPEVVKNDPIVQEISSIFRKIGVLHQVGYFDEEYEISMDIKVLSQQGGSDCAILIYGEGEVFVNEPDRIRGESMLIKQHIENSGYETVAINAHDWHLLGNEQLRTAFLQQVMINKGIIYNQQEEMS